MYLPGFPAIANDLNTDIAHVGLSLTSYFIGISVGQLIYGPIMDRFGRRKPLVVGLTAYIAAALGCALSPSISFLITMRLLLALGGCVGVAGARVVVRDLFSGNEAARVMSTLVLVFGVSPIIAPTVGGFVTATLSWRFIFLILAAIAAFVLAAVSRFLKESKDADASVSLHPKNIVRQYLNLFREPGFITYTCVTSAAAAGFFSYISGSPFVYMNLLGFTATQFGWMYGANAIGLIMGSQINRKWLQTMKGSEILRIVVIAQFCVVIALLAWSLVGFHSKVGIISLVFCFVCGHGFVNPNAMALALEPFTENVGSAAAMMGCIQMVAGASASGLVSYLHNGTVMPMIWVMTGCSSIGLMVLGRGALLKR
jgi:MFS transporter, DHA1 family, multidrug resistance protein